MLINLDPLASQPLKFKMLILGFGFLGGVEILAAEYMG
jgi:hypothetical protein